MRWTLAAFTTIVLAAVASLACSSSASSTPSATTTPNPTAAPSATAETTATSQPAGTATAAPLPFQVKQITTRSGVTLPVALAVPANAKATLIVFTGGNGTGPFAGSGPTFHLSGNFAVRVTPSLVAQGYAAAIVDVPSDEKAGIGPVFRTSTPHAQDISKLIDYLDSLGLKSIYLFGTSYGTISEAYLSSVLDDPRISGIVLTSTVTAAPHFGDIVFSRISVPVLMVHHRDDGCPDSPFAGDAALIKKLTHSPKVSFIEVDGGSPPQSGPCDAQAQHGYYGIEAPVVQAISDWIAGKQVPATIGP